MKKSKKAFAYSSTGLLVLGVLAMTGFLSFVGMFYIVPVVGIALGSFYFAAIVEGEAYKQNILSGIKKLLTQDYTKKKIIKKKLDQLLENELNLQKSQFLRDYQQQRDYLASLKKNRADENLIQKNKKRLRLMKSFFMRWVYQDKALYPSKLANELDELELVDFKNQACREIKRKLLINRLAWIFYILAGISSGFATISGIQTGITTLMVAFTFTLTSTFLLGGIIPLGIMAGIGYTLVLYSQVSDFIQNDKVQKWTKKIYNFFKYQSNENKVLYILRIVGAGLLVTAVVSLAIFTTIATAGTWWMAVKQGARLIPFFVSVADWIRNITVPAMTIPTLILNLKTSFETITKLIKLSVRDKWKEETGKIKKAWKKETCVQFFNPFRFVTKAIEYTFNFLNLLGHLVADAVMGDNFASVPRIPTVVLNATGEALEHGTYLMQTKKNEKGEHKHTTLLDVVLLIGLSPVYLLSFGWDYTFGKENTKDSAKKIFKPYIKFLSIFIPALRKNNHLENISTPNISDEWKRQELVLKFEQKAANYQCKKTGNKKNVKEQKYQALTSIKDEIASAKLSENQEIKQEQPITKMIQEKIDYSILTKHRNKAFGNENKICKSAKFVSKVINDRDYQSVPISI